jgi:hypothetical protein
MMLGPWHNFFTRQLKRHSMSDKTSNPEKSRKEKEKKTGVRQPDPETLHTTDPQEHMKGPVSSIMQKVKDKAEKNNQEDKDDPELQHK